MVNQFRICQRDYPFFVTKRFIYQMNICTGQGKKKIKQFLADQDILLLHQPSINYFLTSNTSPLGCVFIKLYFIHSYLGTHNSSIINLVDDSSDDNLLCPASILEDSIVSLLPHTVNSSNQWFLYNATPLLFPLQCSIAHASSPCQSRLPHGTPCHASSLFHWYPVTLHRNNMCWMVSVSK